MTECPFRISAHTHHWQNPSISVGLTDHLMWCPDSSPHPTMVRKRRIRHLEFIIPNPYGRKAVVPLRTHAHLAKLRVHVGVGLRRYSCWVNEHAGDSCLMCPDKTMATPEQAAV